MYWDSEQVAKFVAKEATEREKALNGEILALRIALEDLREENNQLKLKLANLGKG